MNSKKLFKTLLWSLAGLTLVLTGCTKKGDSSSSKPNPDSSSSGTSTNPPITGGSDSSSSSTTPIPPDPTSLALDVVFNWDTNTHVTTEGMSIWTDRYVDGTIAPLSANVSGLAEDRRTTNPEGNYRWNFAIDANGYIAYASWGTNAGYGGPSDGFYYRPAYQWDKTTAAGTDSFPVFAIAADWEAWPAGTASHYDYVIPEGGFIITGRGEDANGFVQFLNFLYPESTYTSEEVVAMQESNKLLELDTAKGDFDDFYVFINEDKQLEVMLREDAGDETPAYLCEPEEAPVDLFDDIAEVITKENDTAVTVRGVITSMYDDGILVIADETGSVLVKDTTFQYVPEKAERAYTIGQTVRVDGTFSVVAGQNTITPTQEPEVLSKYWAVTSPNPIVITDYATQWVVANQNKIVTMKELIYVGTTGEISTFNDAEGNVYKGRNITLYADAQPNDKFDIKGVLQVENNTEVIFRTNSLNDVTGYATITLVNGTFKGTDESVKDFALGSKVTIVADDKTGERFVRWVSGDSVATSKEYEIPVNGNVTWTAEYSDKATITVVNGTIDGQEGTTVELNVDTEVTIIANQPESGYIFSGWYSGDTLISAESTFTFQLKDNVTYTAKFEREFNPDPVEGAITPDLMNQNFAANDGNEIGIYTDEAINGKLPQTSQYDSSKYTFNSLESWTSVVSVSDEGKILAIGFSYWLGYGGSYNGPDNTFNGFNQYPDLLNKDNPSFAVSPNWKPWTQEDGSKYSNLWEWAVPEGGFLIGMKGSATGKILALIMDDASLEAKVAQGGDVYNYSHFKADYPNGIPEYTRLYLTFDNQILIDYEKNVKATPTVINPSSATNDFALWTDNWLNGTIAPESENKYGNVPEGRRTFITPEAADGQKAAGFTFAVNAQGKLVYASYGLNAGYGSPADKFYSRVGEEGVNNPIFYVSDEFAPWPDSHFDEYDCVIPEGGFVFTLTDPTDEGLVTIMNMLMKGIVDTPYSVDNPVPTNNDLLFGTAMSAGLVSNGVWDHFTFSLTKMGKICVVDDNAPVEDTPQINVAPYSDTYSVFVEDAENAVASGIDSTRTAVVESADKNQEKYLADSSAELLYIAVDSEGRITYLVFAPRLGHGTAYSDSYYRNSYYAYGTREEDELPNHEFGTDRVNPALVVDETSALSWGFYSKWQLVVPQDGFVVVAKGEAANDFLDQIFGQTFDLSTVTSRTAAAQQINRDQALHALVSDDTTLTLDRETYEVTVNAGLASNKAFVKVEGGTFKDETTTQKIVDKNTNVTIVANNPVGQTFLGWYNGEELLSTDKEYTYLVTETITLTAKFAITEQGFAYDLINPEAAPTKGEFTIYTDNEVSGTIAADCPNTYGKAPEGSKTFFKDTTGYTIAVDANGYIVYASFGFGGGYGGPGDGFYSRVGQEGTKNPIFYVGDDWAPWQAGKDNHNHFDYIIPDGGFVFTASATDVTMVNLLKHITGQTTIPTTNNALFETNTADGSLDKWHLSLTEAGNIRVQDRTNIQVDPVYVTATVTLVGGTVNGETTATLEANSLVTVFANNQEGKVFAGWYNEWDELVSTEEAYTFRLSKTGANLTAKFDTEYEPDTVEATVNVENAVIKTVDDVPYEEGVTKIYAGDVVTVEKAEGIEFVKWQQDGVDVSSYLKDGVLIVRDAAYTFTVEAGETTIKAVAKQEYASGSFDVSVKLDGYGTLNSYWPAGSSIKVGTKVANQFRMVLLVNEEGTITQILPVLPATERLVVEEGFAIVGHLTPFNELLSYMLGETILENESNKDTVLAKLEAEKADYKLVVENGVLTVSKLVAKNRTDLIDMIAKAEENDIVKIGATTIDITGIDLTKNIVLQGVNQESTILTSSQHISTSLQGVKDLTIQTTCHVDVAENAHTAFENVTINVTEEGMAGVRGEGALRFQGGNGAIVVKNCTLNGSLWVFGTEESQDLAGITGNTIRAIQSGIVYHANTESASANMTADAIREANGTIIVDDLRDRVVVIENKSWEAVDTSAPEEVTITLEGAVIETINGIAYVEDTKTLAGDEITVKKADTVENFIKWQQDGVDVSSYLKDGVLIVRDDVYSFTLTENTTISAISKTAVAAEGKFDISVGLDGYGTLMSYWTTGQNLEVGKTMANAYRTLITVDASGKITNVSYGIYAATTVGEGFALAAHDATINEFLTYILGEDTVISDTNRDTVYASLLAVKDDFTLSVTDGVLTVTEVTVVEPTPQTSAIAMTGFADFAGTSYATSEQTAEVGGVTYVANNYMANGQIRGNKTAVADNFYFANTTAMPGVITKIEITSTATGNNKFSNAMKVAVGTTSQADVTDVTDCRDGVLTNDLQMTFEFDAADGITYFKLLSAAKFTSGSVIGCTITITYLA